MLNYENLKKVTELMYFISGPFIAFFAWKMMAQLKIGSDQVKNAVAQTKITKEITKIQIERESRLASAKQIEIFANVIIPEMIQFDELRKKGKYPILSRSSVTEDLPRIYYNTDDLPGLCDEIVYSNGRLAIKVLNRIECLATYFTCGIADTEMAYRPLSNSFCEFVRIFLPYIVIANNIDKQFSSTLTMYGTWSARDKVEKANNEISKHKKTLNEIIVPEIKPFGLSKLK